MGRTHQGNASLAIDGAASTPVPIQDVLMHLRNDSSASCIPSVSAPCNYTLELLKLTFGPGTMSGVSVTSLELRNTQSIPLQAFPSEGGYQANLPDVLEFDGTLVSDQGTFRGALTVQSSLIMMINPPGDDLELVNSFDGVVDGHPFHATIDVAADAPLVNLPPVAHASGPGIVRPTSCNATISLDGRTTTDPNGDIISWIWTEGQFTIGGLPLITVPHVARGAHTYQLRVNDSYLGQSIDTVTVTVSPQVKPVISPVTTVSATSCTNVVLTPPTVVHPCGFPTTITNNAPAHFSAGTTVVRWTATDDLGTSAFVDQTVIVYLGNDTACCPPGSHIIVGTSNNDTLNGTSGPDCILGLGAQDHINGNGGNDVISGGDGDDVISGGDDNDTISGGAGQDVIHGDNGDDFLSGNDGDDNLFGDAGNDRLDGGPGNDHLTGGIGTDICVGGPGTNTPATCEVVQ